MSDRQSLQTFYMHAKRRILSVKWYDRVRNIKVSILTCHVVYNRLQDVDPPCFGNVVRLASDTPANHALSLTVDVRLGSYPS